MSVKDKKNSLIKYWYLSAIWKGNIIYWFREEQCRLVRQRPICSLGGPVPLSNGAPSHWVWAWWAAPGAHNTVPQQPQTQQALKQGVQRGAAGGRAGDKVPSPAGLELEAGTLAAQIRQWLKASGCAEMGLLAPWAVGQGVTEGLVRAIQASKIPTVLNHKPVEDQKAFRGNIICLPAFLQVPASGCFEVRTLSYMDVCSDQQSCLYGWWHSTKLSTWADSAFIPREFLDPTEVTSILEGLPSNKGPEQGWRQRGIYLDKEKGLRHNSSR